VTYGMHEDRVLQLEKLPRMIGTESHWNAPVTNMNCCRLSKDIKNTLLSENRRMKQSILNVSLDIFAVNQLILSLVRAVNRSSSVDPGQIGEILERDLSSAKRGKL